MGSEIRKVKLTELSNYSDEMGNTIVCSRPIAVTSITFRGRNNRIVVHDNASIKKLKVMFDCDNGYLEIGRNRFKSKGLRATIRVGQSASVIIGNDISCTNICTMTAVEESSISIGNDCMFASENEIRTDDAHPIFDVASGKRINPSRNIKIGNHVWLARKSIVLGGAEIGDGSVLGFYALLSKKIPNNCIAAGIPAKIIKKNIAWERPHLSITKPYMKPDKNAVKISEYWNFTLDPNDFDN